VEASYPKWMTLSHDQLETLIFALHISLLRVQGKKDAEIHYPYREGRYRSDINV
jgi:hypothetical protein